MYNPLGILATCWAWFLIYLYHCFTIIFSHKIYSWPISLSCYYIWKTYYSPFHTCNTRKEYLNLKASNRIMILFLSKLHNHFKPHASVIIFTALIEQWLFINVMHGWNERPFFIRGNPCHYGTISHVDIHSDIKRM